MRIAVTYEKEQVFPHFGKTDRFKIYEIADGQVKLATVINTNGSHYGALPDILRKIEVNVLICGKIGSGAKRALEEAEIALYCGASGRTDDVVQLLLEGKLVSDLSAVQANPSRRKNQKTESV